MAQSYRMDSKGWNDNGPYEGKSTGDRVRFKMSFKDDSMIFWLWKWINGGVLHRKV